MKTNNKWHLRVTVLPQCNFRCRYCNPTGAYQKAKLLTIEEILEIVKASVANGIKRVHWTGGEPCLADVVNLFTESKKLGMVNQIMTTNGSLKIDQIEKMKESGLDRVNISLDTLCAETNKDITGRDMFENTLKWINTATTVFEQPTKMNIVPMRDNIDGLPQFIEFAQRFKGKLMLKFIELCPNNPAFYGNQIQDFFVGREEIIRRLSKISKPLKLTTGVGDNPNAEYYEVGNTGVVVILITMPSQNFKCGLSACHKMRISPYGLVGSCIQQKGASLMGESHESKVRIIKERMDIRESLSDTPPVERQHRRSDYGVWRFGKLDSEECIKC